jgi:uncharacterized protein
MFEPRISLITLGVRDLDRARVFYGALGWREAGGADGVAFFQLGPLALSLYRWDDLARDAGLAPAGEGFRGVALAYNVRERGEVDVRLAQAAAVGARVVKDGHDVVWGGRIAYFADPDGHLWEIAWNPGFPSGADGAITVKL